MNQQVRRAFIAMGYRRIAPGKWAKPLGWMLLTVEEDPRESTLWFKGAGNDQMCRWETKKLFEDRFGDPLPEDYDTALVETKAAEADLICKWSGNYWDTRFEFLTDEQRALAMVGSLV
jgi:hypothetical protein